MNAKCITHKTPNVIDKLIDRLSLNVALPLRLTYSIPLPLWCQTPKPKGQSAGLQRTSYNTLGVWLPHLHLHFINMSIIHSFMRLDCLEHAFETLQHLFIFHVCLFYEMNSVQHSSATCATHS